MTRVLSALLALLLLAAPAASTASPPNWRASVVLHKTSVSTDPVPGYVAAIVNGYASPPSAGAQTCILNFVDLLYDNAVWVRLDVLYVLAAGEDQGSRVNWKAPGSFNASKVGTGGTFTTKQGWSGFSSGNYLSSTYDPLVAGGQLTRNNNSFFVATVTDTNDASSAFPAGNTQFSVQPRTSAGAIASRNATSTLNTGAANTGSGLYLISRTSGTGYDRYRTGSLFDSPAQASSTLISAAIFVGTTNNLQFTTKTVSLVGWGGGMDATQASVLNTGYVNYMTCIAGT